jgi:hypothetical protein
MKTTITLILMGLLSFLSSSKGEAPDKAGPIIVDLKTFTIEKTALGVKPNPEDFFSAALSKNEELNSAHLGLELSAKDGLLDSIFIDLSRFKGNLPLSSTPSGFSKDSTEKEVLAKLGEPYWIDRDEGEVICFYEFNRGKVELQFEFGASGKLAYVTLMRNGILSDKEQRKNYGVTKPWPPE